jgi:hypothetical protein
MLFSSGFSPMHSSGPGDGLVVGVGLGDVAVPVGVEAPVKILADVTASAVPPGVTAVLAAPAVVLSLGVGVGVGVGASLGLGVWAGAGAGAGAAVPVPEPAVVPVPVFVPAVVPVPVPVVVPVPVPVVPVPEPVVPVPVPVVPVPVPVVPVPVVGVPVVDTSLHCGLVVLTADIRAWAGIGAWAVAAAAPDPAWFKVVTVTMPKLDADTTRKPPAATLTAGRTCGKRIERPALPVRCFRNESSVGVAIC